MKLDELLDEAVERAAAVIAGRGEEMGKLQADELDAVARAVGIGAVKYADLSTDRTRATTGSTGTGCSLLMGTPVPTSNTRTPESAASSGGRRRRERLRPPVSMRLSVSAPSATSVSTRSAS